MIVIDGVTYDVDYETFARGGAIARKYELQTADGKMHNEPIGTYLSYDIAFGNISEELRQVLLRVFLEPVEYRTITLPDAVDGAITFEATIDSVNNNLLSEDPVTGLKTWSSLVVTITSREPVEVV